MGLQEIKSLQTMVAESVDDKGMLNMATEELELALEEEKRLHGVLLKELLPKDDADDRDCIIEVRAGNIWLGGGVCDSFHSSIHVPIQDMLFYVGYLMLFV